MDAAALKDGERLVECIEYLEDERDEESNMLREELVERLLASIDKIADDSTVSEELRAYGDALRGRGLVFGRGLVPGASDASGALESGSGALSRAVKRLGGQGAAWVALGRASWELGDVSTARTCLEDGVRQGGGPRAACALSSLLRSGASRALGEGGSAGRELGAALALAKGAATAASRDGMASAEAWHEVGLSYLAASFLSGAERSVALGRDKGPWDALTQASRALLMAVRSNEPFERELMSGTTSVASHVRTVLEDKIDLEAGISMRKKLGGRPLPQAHHNRGQVLRFRQEFDAAIQSYARALALDPSLTASRDGAKVTADAFRAALSALADTSRGRRKAETSAREALWEESTSEAVVRAAQTAAKNLELKTAIHRTDAQTLLSSSSSSPTPSSDPTSTPFLALKMLKALPRGDATPAVLVATDGRSEAPILLCLYGARETGLARISDKETIVLLQPTIHQTTLDLKLADAVANADMELVRTIATNPSPPSHPEDTHTIRMFLAPTAQHVQIVAPGSVDWETILFAPPVLRSHRLS